MVLQSPNVSSKAIFSLIIYNYYFQNTVEEHKRRFSEDLMRDFIDIYLKEMKENENNPDGSPFSGKYIFLLILTTVFCFPEAVIINLFFLGSKANL